MAASKKVEEKVETPAPKSTKNKDGFEAGQQVTQEELRAFIAKKRQANK